MVGHIHVNLLGKAIVRLTHPWRGDKQGHETCLAPPADKKTPNYDKEYSNSPIYRNTTKMDLTIETGEGGSSKDTSFSQLVLTQRFSSGDAIISMKTREIITKPESQYITLKDYIYYTRNF